MLAAEAPVLVRVYPHIQSVSFSVPLDTFQHANDLWFAGNEISRFKRTRTQFRHVLFCTFLHRHIRTSHQQLIRV